MKLLPGISASFVLALVVLPIHAQVNSGSNGSDGAFNPTTNTVINMTDHPDGIYQYTSINISNGVTVTFIPNANNTPVVWLVQSNCVISGTVNLSAQQALTVQGTVGGPGGFRGGNGAFQNNVPTGGQGPGGGLALTNCSGGNGSFGTKGDLTVNCGGGEPRVLAGEVYGNSFLLPLIGGSGGGGCYAANAGPPLGGGGGGGALLIAASGFIEITGAVQSRGGGVSCSSFQGGSGSGGAVRLVANSIKGTGTIDTSEGYNVCGYNHAGRGRIRLDGLDIQFAGTLNGESSRGFQPIIIPTAGQGAQLTITSVGGVPVSVSPTGGIATPDTVLSAQQNNPIPVVVHCSNIPLNTQITVSVKPANGATVSATGLNNIGTPSSSTATISITIPRGGGIFYATAAN